MGKVTIGNGNLLDIGTRPTSERVSLEGPAVNIRQLISAIDQFTTQQVSVTIEEKTKENELKAKAVAAELTARGGGVKEFQKQIKTVNPFNPATADAYNSVIRSSLSNIYINGIKGGIDREVDSFERQEEKPEDSEPSSKHTFSQLVGIIDAQVNTSIKAVVDSEDFDDKTKETIVGELGKYSERVKSAAAQRHVRRQVALMTFQQKTALETEGQRLRKALIDVADDSKTDLAAKIKLFKDDITEYRKRITEATVSGMDPRVGFTMYKNAHDEYAKEFFGRLYQKALFSGDDGTAQQLHDKIVSGDLFEHSADFGKTIGDKKVTSILINRVAEEASDLADKGLKISTENEGSFEERYLRLKEEVLSVARGSVNKSIREGLPQDVGDKTYSLVHDRIMKDFLDSEMGKAKADPKVKAEIIEKVNSGDAYFDNDYIDSRAVHDVFRSTTAFLNKFFATTAGYNSGKVEIQIPPELQAAYGTDKINLENVETMITTAETIFGKGSIEAQSLEQYKVAFTELKAQIAATKGGKSAIEKFVDRAYPDNISLTQRQQLQAHRNRFIKGLRHAENNNDFRSYYYELYPNKEDIGTIIDTKPVPGQDDATFLKVKIDKAKVIYDEQSKAIDQLFGEGKRNQSFPLTGKTAKKLAGLVVQSTRNNDMESLADLSIYLSGIFEDENPVQKQAALLQIYHSANKEEVSAILPLFFHAALAENLILNEKGINAFKDKAEDKLKLIKNKLITVLKEFGPTTSPSLVPDYSNTVKTYEAGLLSSKFENIKTFVRVFSPGGNPEEVMPYLRGIFRTKVLEELAKGEDVSVSKASRLAREGLDSLIGRIINPLVYPDPTLGKSMLISGLTKEKDKERLDRVFKLLFDSKLLKNNHALDSSITKYNEEDLDSLIRTIIPKVEIKDGKDKGKRTVISFSFSNGDPVIIEQDLDVGPYDDARNLESRLMSKKRNNLLMLDITDLVEKR